MTFGDAEIGDYPPPSWLTKEELSTEIITLTDESLEELRTVYDNESETIQNIIKFGICSTCGRSVTKQNIVRCLYGCQLCDKCRPEYLGRAVCRRHVESRFASKYETIVLIGIVSKINKVKLLKVGKITENEYQTVRINLEEKGYIKFSTIGLENRPKITPSGYEVLSLLISTYQKDPDFAIFLQEIGVVIGPVQAGTKQ